MRRVFLALIAMLLISVSGMSKVQAASEADCAIWVCLPGGFPSGCAAAHRAFLDRLKHGRPPLPELWACSSGPDGERVNGQYQLGTEIFEVCIRGYVLREDNRNDFPRGKCYLAQCAPERYQASNERYCKNYEAVRRAKPSYVKMWVSGDYLGQFWYQ